MSRWIVARQPDRLRVAITGASGALYATRTLAALLERAVHVELVVSDYGRRLLRDELGEAASVDRLRDVSGRRRTGEGVSRGTFDAAQQPRSRARRSRAAAMAARAMVDRAVLDEDARGRRARAVAQSVERAADVMLKERRRWSSCRAKRR